MKSLKESKTGDELYLIETGCDPRKVIVESASKNSIVVEKLHYDISTGRGKHSMNHHCHFILITPNKFRNNFPNKI